MYQPEEGGSDRGSIPVRGCNCLDCIQWDCSCVTGGSNECLCDICGCGRDDIKYTFAKGGGHD